THIQQLCLRYPQSVCSSDCPSSGEVRREKLSIQTRFPTRSSANVDSEVGGDESCNALHEPSSLTHTHTTRTQKPAPKRNARQNAGASSRFSLNLPVGREERARSHDVWPERRGWLSNPALLPCGSWCVEEKKEDGDSEIQEHGPEHWFSKWERQCLAEAEQREPSEEEADNDQDKLWHLFQNSATAVAQLYKDRACHQQGLSLWVPFQNSATAVTNLYKESAEAHQRSFDRGIQIGHQRRNKDMLAWVKKRRRTIRREDLISFLCGKAPPHRSSRANPRLAMVAPSRANSPAETGSSVETDLQPFREAIALHGLSGAMASISVRSGAPGSPTHVSGSTSNGGAAGVGGSSGSTPVCRSRRNGLQDVDLNTFISEEMALHLDSTGSASAGGGGARKRNSTQCSDVITDSPTHKRNRMI
uniref:HUWE1 associated protein modifying stress responses a n=1 Tax=Gasterosteus aculeatus aculeatus TaxID=481459 RepID=A0AAQ4RA93_GASAC